MKVNTAVFITSAAKAEQYPESVNEEIVLLGRSNVGKSTFINSFTNNKKLAYISSKPGKTQVLNFFLINDLFTLVDVPGYGYAKVSKKQREEFGKMIEEYLTTRPSLRLAVLLVDFKVGPTEDDIIMQNFLDYYDIETLIVATKKDKVKKSLWPKHENKIIESFINVNRDNIICYSKEDKNTLKPVNDYIFNIFKDGNE